MISSTSTLKTPASSEEGDGVGVLFDKLPAAGGPRVLPKALGSKLGTGSPVGWDEGCSYAGDLL